MPMLVDLIMTLHEGSDVSRGFRQVRGTVIDVIGPSRYLDILGMP